MNKPKTTSEIVEKIDQALEPDLSMYRDYAQQAAQGLKASLTLIKQLTGKLKADEHVIVNDMLINIRNELINPEFVAISAEYIGMSPCIDVIYTNITVILLIIMGTTDVIMKFKSLSLVSLFTKRLANITPMVNKLERLLVSISQAEQVAMGLAKNTD